MKLLVQKAFTCKFSDVRDQEAHFDLPAPVNEDEDEMVKRAIAMSLEEQSRVVEEEEGEEEMLARVLALSMEDK